MIYIRPGRRTSTTRRRRTSSGRSGSPARWGCRSGWCCPRVATGRTSRPPCGAGWSSRRGCTPGSSRWPTRCTTSRCRHRRRLRRRPAARRPGRQGRPRGPAVAAVALRRDGRAAARLPRRRRGRPAPRGCLDGVLRPGRDRRRPPQPAHPPAAAHPAEPRGDHRGATARRAGDGGVDAVRPPVGGPGRAGGPPGAEAGPLLLPRDAPHRLRPRGPPVRATTRARAARRSATPSYPRPSSGR